MGHLVTRRGIQSAAIMPVEPTLPLPDPRTQKETPALLVGCVRHALGCFPASLGYFLIPYGLPLPLQKSPDSG